MRSCLDKQDFCFRCKYNPEKGSFVPRELNIKRNKLHNEVVILHVTHTVLKQIAFQYNKQYFFTMKTQERQ